MTDEVWWTAFGAVAQAVGAVATFAAVAVSLLIVRSERELRARATAGIRLFFAGDGTPGIYLVGVTVLNTGMRPIRVTSTGWRTGWVHRGPTALRHRCAIQNSSLVHYGERPPIIIEPDMEASIYTTIADMKQAVRNGSDAHKELFERKVSLLGEAPIYATISFTGRRALLVKVEKTLAEFLRSNDHPSTTSD